MKNTKVRSIIVVSTIYITAIIFAFISTLFVYGDNLLIKAAVADLVGTIFIFILLAGQLFGNTFDPHSSHFFRMFACLFYS